MAGKWLNAQEIADAVGVEKQTVYYWHRHGVIPGRKISSKIVRFQLDAVIKALEGREIARKAAKAAAL